MKLVVPVQDPTTQAIPSTQEVVILSGGADQNYLLFTLRQDPTTGPVRKCLDLALPIMAAAEFGTTEFPFPPTGTVYFFANSTNTNKPSVINHAGVVTVVGENADPELDSLTVNGESILNGDVSVLPASGSTISTMKFDEDGDTVVEYNPGGTTWTFTAGNTITLGLDSGQIKIGMKGGVKIGFFNTTPIVQPTITAAAPTDTATLIDQVVALKTLLDNLGLLNQV